MTEMIQTWEVALDLDGVLADFAKRALEIAGYEPDHSPKNRQLRADFWRVIGTHIRTPGNTFFESMDKMLGADDLVSYVAPYTPFILSATGNHFTTASTEKRNWVRKHYGHDLANLAVFVRDARDKAQYAAPNRILVDDRRKAIDPWREAGGIGILHTSAESSIAQLKEMGL